MAMRSFRFVDNTILVTSAHQSPFSNDIPAIVAKARQAAAASGSIWRALVRHVT
jgi:hypothetical protein